MYRSLRARKFDIVFACHIYACFCVYPLFKYFICLLLHLKHFLNFPSAMKKKITGAKIACLDFSLQKEKLKLGIQVLVNDPAKLESIRQRESDITKVRRECV